MSRVLRMAARIGMAGLAVRGVRRAVDARADRRFMTFDPAEDRAYEVGGRRFLLPGGWHRTDGFAAYWLADLDAVSALLPSADLHPVRADARHGVVGVAAFRHFESTVRTAAGGSVLLPPYGEAGIFIAVTRRSMPPLVPFLLQRLLDVAGSGGYLLHLPVTSRFHRDCGRTVWGLPKFVADMEFSDEGASHGLRLTEGGQSIFELRVERSGNAALSRAPNLLYSVRDGQLVQIRMASRSFTQAGLGGRAAVTVGDHPAAVELREVGLAKQPLMTAVVQQQRFVMPPRHEIGPARPRAWYEGSDAEFGRFVTRHADGTLTDHYAVHLAGAAAGREREAVAAG